MSKARLVITAVVLEKRPASEVARSYGVARSWVYALAARYAAEGEAAFEPRSRRPKTSPSAISDDAADLARLTRAERYSNSAEGDKRADELAREVFRARYAAFLAPDGVVVLPVMPDLPPLRTASREELLRFRSTCFRFSAAASLTGSPEVVVPVGHSASGRTFGVGLLGQRGGDLTLMRVLPAIAAGGAPLSA
jgi:Asp-tRNA(Asn)/Glu-tRNA(Gln) amidotransferase A subunit family amidase